MRSLWITLILVAIGGASVNSPSLAQTPEQLYQKGNERIEKKGDAEATQHQKTNIPKLKQPRLDRIGAALSRGTQSFFHNVLQFLKTAGKSLVTGGILTILLIFILLMLIIHLHVSFAGKREWKFVL